jgi:hypothetical protein
VSHNHTTCILEQLWEMSRREEIENQMVVSQELTLYNKKGPQLRGMKIPKMVEEATMEVVKEETTLRSQSKPGELIVSHQALKRQQCETQPQ